MRCGRRSAAPHAKSSARRCYLLSDNDLLGRRIAANSSPLRFIRPRLLTTFDSRLYKLRKSMKSHDLFQKSGGAGVAKEKYSRGPFHARVKGVIFGFTEKSIMLFPARSADAQAVPIAGAWSARREGIQTVAAQFEARQDLNRPHKASAFLGGLQLAAQFTRCPRHDAPNAARVIFFGIRGLSVDRVGPAAIALD